MWRAIEWHFREYGAIWALALMYTTIIGGAILVAVNADARAPMVNPAKAIERGGFEHEGRTYLVTPAPPGVRITPDGPALLVDNAPAKEND